MKVHKQEVLCTQWYALHTMATLFNNHPYISNSKFSANWHATATYVGMIEESCHLHFGTNQSAYDMGVQLKDWFTPTTFTQALSVPVEA